MSFIQTSRTRVWRPRHVTGANPRWRSRLRALYNFTPALWRIDQSRGIVGGTEAGSGTLFSLDGLQTPGSASNGVRLAHSITSFAQPLTFVIGSHWLSQAGVDWSLLDNTSGVWTGFYGNSSAGTQLAACTSSNSFDGVLAVTASLNQPSNYVFSFRGVNDGYAIGLNRSTATDGSVTPPTSFSNTAIALGWSERGGVNDNPTIVQFSHFAVLQGHVSVSEMGELADNPWQLFASERRPVFYSISGVSPGPSTANRIMLLRRPGLSRVWR